MALLGITVEDEEFYKLAQEGEEIIIDIKNRKVICCDKEFKFGLSLMEEKLIAAGGVTKMYEKYGIKLFRAAVADNEQTSSCGSEANKNSIIDNCNNNNSKELAW